MGEVLGIIAVIAMILFNIIGIIRLGLSLDHPFLVTIAYIVVLVVIGNINGYVCLIVVLAVAVISLIACIIGIVLRCKEAVFWIQEEIEEKRLEKEQKQRNVDLLDAVMNGDVESAKKLIEMGGDIEYCDSEKQEPMLQIAIKKSDKEMVSLLLDNGADENCVCNDKTPLDVATNEEIIILLKSKGAKTKAELEAEAEELNTKGYSFFKGIGVEKDYAKAVEFWEKAVELGNIQAHNSLAICYMYAYGVDRDYYKAFKLNEVAAKAGVANAQCNLGFLYSKGAGVYQSDTQAMYWWEKAAGQGHSDAQCNLGLCYLEKKSTEALYWFDKSVEQGNVNAFYCKGLYYDKFFDYQNAGLWFEKAARRGHEKALERLRDLCSSGLYYIIE